MSLQAGCYYGQERAVTFYNLVSDQFTRLNGITVPGTLRDSLTLLSVVLEQQTELQPTEMRVRYGRAESRPTSSGRTRYRRPRGRRAWRRYGNWIDPPSSPPSPRSKPPNPRGASRRSIRSRGAQRADRRPQCRNVRRRVRRSPD